MKNATNDNDTWQALSLATRRLLAKQPNYREAENENSERRHSAKGYKYPCAYLALIESGIRETGVC